MMISVHWMKRAAPAGETCGQLSLPWKTGSRPSAWAVRPLDKIPGAIKRAVLGAELGERPGLHRKSIAKCADTKVVWMPRGARMPPPCWRSLRHGRESLGGVSAIS